MGIARIFCVLTVLSGLSLVQADLFGQLPKCSIDCFTGALGNHTTQCGSTDIPCLCGDAPFLNVVQMCQATTCTTKEILTSTNATLAACGVPPHNVSPIVIGIPASFGSLAILLYLLRIFDRVVLMKLGMGWDDILLGVGVLLGAVLNFICYPMAAYGMGKDFWTIPFPNINETLKLLYIAEIFYFPSEMFTQLSILAFYRRVFAKTSDLLQKGSVFLMVFVVLFGVANTLTIIFQCTPVDYFWTSWTGEVAGGRCIDISLFSWSRAAIEIAVDIAIISLPLRDLSRLQLSWRMKAQVILMFSLGFVVTIVSILRLQSLIQFAQTTNPTVDNAPGVYWSVLECDIFIISACLPSVRSLLGKMAPRFFGTTRRGDGDNSRQPQYHNNNVKPSASSFSSRKYYRQKDNDDEEGDYRMSHLSSSHKVGGGGLVGNGKILKSVDLRITHESRETADDKELLGGGHVYGA
ncbi:hypothetical protein F5Y17DRAFT_457887 [Xylariaceae sp. FL0594]|nr:hypothetical protein F5Y17DRAFT_457887 [Xylariaceae sp. FL0594]